MSPRVGRADERRWFVWTACSRRLSREFERSFRTSKSCLWIRARFACASPSIFGQAITHVLSNGIIHNDSDRPRIELDVTVGEERVLLSIADNGPGIPDERKDLVFGREETDQLHYENGFGLIFVKNVVEDGDGESWIEDNEPRGSVFKIALDLEPREPVDRAEGA